MVSLLLNYLNSLTPLAAQEADEIGKYLYVRKISKGQHLVQENQLSDHLTYITRGYFRVYIHNEDDEMTVHLASPNNFVCAFYSFISRTPSRENLQAVTDAEVIFISYEDLQHLYKTSHKVERLGRLLTEKHFLEKEQRVISFIRESGEMRYRDLLEKRPDLLLHVPLQYIASYLGMKPETLSRIRAKSNY